VTPVSVIGVNGGPLSARARERLAAATLVVGARRHLDAVPVPGQARIHQLRDVEAAVDAVARAGGRTVVLATGDPGFFGIVRLLRTRGVDLEVIPAVSTVSAAFAEAGLSWDDALVVSAHGRDLRRAVNACRAAAKVAVLTAPGTGPAQLGAALTGLTGLTGLNRRMVVAERLGTPAQRVVECTPEEAAGRSWADPNVVLVLRDDPAERGPAERGWAFPRRQCPPGWGLPDDAFEHRAGMLTKAEVRAVALGWLGPGLGDLVWDVGAGCGSVAVECARFGAAVVAVDRDPDQCDRTRRNASAHRVEVQVVCAAAPACLADLPDPDTAFVGGGGLDAIIACAAREPRAVVVALAAVDRVAPAREALRRAAYRVGGVAVHSSRLADLPDGSTRLAATNPVFLLCGQR
jgi:precorrin-6Y C5,15-methyltransferase (decarboxylating)